MDPKFSVFSHEFVWIVSKSVVGKAQGVFPGLPKGLLGVAFFPNGMCKITHRQTYR